jgi:hypothetical protein
MPTPENNTDRKSRLEIEKLELDLEKARARTGVETIEREKAAADLNAVRLDNERREREKEQADIAREKLQLEVEDLRRRPHAWWQRAQIMVVIAGVGISTFSAAISCFNYRKSVRDEHEKNITTAEEHLQKGDPAGAVELGRYDDALSLLVRSVDATHLTIQESWPIGTRAALHEIFKRRNQLTAEQKEQLEKEMTDSVAALGKQVLVVKMTPPGGPTTPTITSPTAMEVQTNLLQNLACIQLDLRQILRNPGDKPDEKWDNTFSAVKGQLGAEPHC